MDYELISVIQRTLTNVKVIIKDIEEKQSSIEREDNESSNKEKLDLIEIKVNELYSEVRELHEKLSGIE